MSDTNNPYTGSFGQQMTGQVNSGQVNSGPVNPGHVETGQARPGQADTMPGGLDLMASTAGEALIKETTTADFTADVIQESRQQPVIVDFWAPWCGPCRQLTPVLEKTVKAAGGKVKLVKMNIDDHPTIAGQLGVQSIPAVLAFVNGQPVDGFMGAVPESQVNEFIARLGASSGTARQADIDSTLAAAGDALNDGRIDEAAQAYTAILQADPENLKARIGIADVMDTAGQSDRARALLDQLSEDERKNPDAVRLFTRMAQAEEVSKLGDPVELEARLALDPDDHAARLDFAKILNARGRREAAAEELLVIMRRDRSWDDDGARRALLTFFDAWGAQDPATIAARRKLSSILFS